jgi:uncharacterized membrane protein
MSQKTLGLCGIEEVYMKRIELLGVILASFGLVIAGLTVIFGPYALIAAGVLGLIASFFVNVKE